MKVNEMERNSLTARETDIMSMLILDGIESHDEIAARLFISPKTVKNHFANIYRKLGVRSKAGAVAKAMVLGLINLPETQQLRDENRSLRFTVAFVKEFGRLPTVHDFKKTKS